MKEEELKLQYANNKYTFFYLAFLQIGGEHQRFARVNSKTRPAHTVWFPAEERGAAAGADRLQKSPEDQQPQRLLQHYRVLTADSEEIWHEDQWSSSILKG